MTAFLVVALVTPLAAQPSERARAEALVRQAETRLRALTQEAERLASEARTLLGDLRKLELDRRIRAEELRRLDAATTAAANDVAVLEQEVSRLEDLRRREQPLLEARLLDLYKLGRGRYIRLLLSTSDLRQVAQASRVVATLAKRDRDRLEAHARRIEDLQASRRAMHERGEQLEALRDDARRAQAAAVRAVQEHERLLREINERRDLNAQLAGELQLAHAKLQDTMQTLNAGGDAVVPALPLGPFRGDLEWPVDGRPRTRWQERSGLASNGIEISAGDGAPVQAIHAGTVVFADAFAGFGRLVIVDHGSENFSVYGHLLDIVVERGALVARGQRLGAVGTPPTGGPGLYFELRVDGRAVNPLQWLKTR